jgi:hypothetical protein
MNRRNLICAGFGLAAFPAVSIGEALIAPPSGRNPKGSVQNCLLMVKQGQTDYMFLIRADGVIVPNLDGYAIVPIDHYRALAGK